MKLLKFSASTYLKTEPLPFRSSILRTKLKSPHKHKQISLKLRTIGINLFVILLPQFNYGFWISYVGVMFAGRVFFHGHCCSVNSRICGYVVLWNCFISSKMSWRLNRFGFIKEKKKKELMNLFFYFFLLVYECTR